MQKSIERVIHNQSQSIGFLRKDLVAVVGLPLNGFTPIRPLQSHGTRKILPPTGKGVGVLLNDRT